MCTSRICRRPSRSGGWTATRRSKRPGLSSAGSRISARLVAASTTTASTDSNPSISVRIWFERLLALVVGAGDRYRPLAGASDRVELVDEDDRRRGLLGLGEQIAHPRCSDPDDRLDELRGRDREERRVCFSSDGARQQRLARPGGAREQHAVGHASSESAVARGVAQEIHDLGQLRLGLVDPGHVGERDRDRGRVDPSCLGAPEVAQRAHAPASWRPGGRTGRTARRSAASVRTRADGLDQGRGLGRRLRVDLDPLGPAAAPSTGRCSRSSEPRVANRVVGVAFASEDG